MSDIDELVQWLRDQIADVEQIARDAIVRKSGGDAWGVGEDRILNWRTDEQDIEVIGGGKPIVQCSCEYGGPMVAAHIAEHDPRTVLAQCEADTLLLNEWSAANSEYSATGRAWDYESEVGRARTSALEDVIRIRAIGYRHRPGYREEWRPCATTG